MASKVSEKRRSKPQRLMEEFTQCSHFSDEINHIVFPHIPLYVLEAIIVGNTGCITVDSLNCTNRHVHWGK